MSSDLHVMRARLTKTPCRTEREKALHDFKNDVVALALAARDGDDGLARFYITVLVKKFQEAIDHGHPHQEKEQGKAA